ncbi:MAG: hypothetical protein NTZ17_07260 [Phycisphaerae bacterium]|nr:hypothetical protein [Phycisphaerae bacterium]
MRNSVGVVDVNVTGSGDYVAGLVGCNGTWWTTAKGGTVTRCYSTGAVRGNFYVGGLVGENGTNGTVTHCYSASTVGGKVSVGGLVGSNTLGWVDTEELFGSVTQCYSTGAVSGSGGGLVGSGSSGVLLSVWDMKTSGLSVSAGGVGLTTTEMMDPFMLGLNGFANDPNWVLDPGRDYPRLAWEGTRGQLIPAPKIDWLAGRGTAEEPYRIDTADQLIFLGRASALCDRHFVLGADINLDPNLASGRVFPQAVIPTLAGVFEGNGHVISHLTIKGPYGSGLFGQLASRAEVRNLGVVDVNVAVEFGGGLVGQNDGDVSRCYSTGVVSGFAGGLVGFNSGGVTDCHSTASVSGLGGGLVGYNLLGTVTRCYSTGAVDGAGLVGGLVGYNDRGTVTECYSTGAVSGEEYGNVGGLVGWNDSGTVTNCYSTGAVDGNDYVGGLVGRNYGNGTVTQCHSTGAVDGNDYVGGLVGSGSNLTECYSTGTVSGNQYVGGLVGSAGNLTRCYSTSAVDGNDYVGGLVGENWAGTVTTCYSIGAVTGTGDYVGGLVGRNYGTGHVTQCYSTGAVSGKSNVGGLVGWNDSSGTVTNCYSAGAVSGKSSVGGLVGGGSEWFVIASFWDIQTSGQAKSAGGVGETTAQMRNLNTFRAAGWSFVWAEPEGGGYPILWWQLPPLQGLPGFSGGTGEPNDPYRISRPEELSSIGDDPRLMQCHFKLVADLDLRGFQFYPIGRDHAYGGVFDGNGHTISHLTINGASCTGLFGCVGSGAEVKDLGVVDVNATYYGRCDNDWDTGCDPVGALVASNGGAVTQCYSTGMVTSTGESVGGLVGFNSGTVIQCYSTGTVSGNDYVGGLVGRNRGTVTRCYSTGTVTGKDYVGGLVGSGGSVTQCYSTGAVSGNADVGGLVGCNGTWWTTAEDGTVTRCYSTGTVRGNSSVGGLVGESLGSVTECYSTGAVSGSDYVAGLVGFNEGDVLQCYSTGAVSGTKHVGGLVGSGGVWSVTASFWDIQTSGQATSAGGTGKTTAQMQTAKTFLDAGWDFVGETKNGTADIWWILEGKDYPRLWWEARN